MITLSLDQLLTLVGLLMAALTTLGGAMVGAIWWLLQRSIAHMDAQFSRLEAALQAIDTEVRRLDREHVELRERVGRDLLPRYPSPSPCAHPLAQTG